MSTEPIAIADEHKPLVAKLTHVCEWTRDELARLQAEMRYVAEQGQRAQASLAALLARTHGVDILHEPGWQVDAEKGVLVPPPTPEQSAEQPAQSSTSEEEVIPHG